MSIDRYGNRSRGVGAGLTRRRVARRWAAATIAAVTAVFGSGLAQSAPAAAASTVAGFEMDGNIAAASASDWSNIGVTPYNDQVGNADVTTYNSTDKESADPSTWNLGNNGTAANKVDIGYHASYVTKDSSTGHWWWFAGWDRYGNTGSGGFLIELNQSASGPIARQTGDVRIVADVSTSNGVVFASARRWNGSAWGATLPSADFVSASNGSAITAASPWDSSPVAVAAQIGAKQFGEIGVDLTAAGLVNDANPCHLTSISSWQLRGATGNSTSDGAPENLSDGTSVHPFDFPPTCGSLAWTKRAGDVTGALLGGATFTVHRTDATAPDVVVTDGSTNDADPVAGQLRVDDLQPGTYTITETAAPAGYIVTSSAVTGLGVTIGQVTNAGAFVNGLGTLEFTKAIAGHPEEKLGGATFTVTALSGAAAGAPWSLAADPLVVADNSSRDLNKSDGLFQITGLPTGTYSVVETGRPAGYDLDATVGYATIATTDPSFVFTSQTPAPGASPYQFADSPRTTSLRIEKSDANTSAPLDGAHFIICRDASATIGFDPAVDCAASQQAGEIVTGSAGAGAAVLSGLPFGDYWVLESSPPAGYDLATPSYWPVGITPANDGAIVTLPITNAPAYGSISWAKRALNSDGPLLGGATFIVHRTDAAAADVTVVDNGANDSDPANGQFRVDNLHIGDYSVTETTPPPGYTLPSTHLVATVAGGTNTFIGSQSDVLGSMVWAKSIAGQPGSHLGGATFTVTAVGGAAAAAPWNLNSSPIVVADNGANDADPSVGGFKLAGLPTGRYTVVETGRPTGYELDSTTGYSTVPMSGSSPAQVYATAEPTETASPYVFADVARTTMLRVVKTDSTTDALLNGAQFLLCADSAASSGFDFSVDCAAEQQIASLVTGTTAPGAAEAGGLAFGDYWLWESVAPTGYDLADPRYWQVSVTVANDGATIVVPIENAPAYGSLSWVKRAGSADGDLLGGATFTIHRTDASGGDLVVIDNGLNDSNPTAGQLTVASIHMGTYTITETTPPAGYFGSSAHIGVVVLPATANSGGVFVNQLGSIRWTKVSANDAGLRVGGAAFTVTAVGGAAAAAPWNLGMNPIVVVDNGIHDADPSDGGFLLTGMPSGSYLVQETTRPLGYNIDPTVGHVTLATADAADVFASATPAAGAVPYVFADSPRTSTLHITKTDEITQDSLDGAVFEVCVDSPISEGFDPAVDCAGSNLVATVVSGAVTPGVADVSGLQFGDYWVYETQAPEGYNVPAAAAQRFSVTPALDGAAVDVTFADPQKPLSVQFYKTDSVTGDGLVGATFEFYFDSGDGWVDLGSCTTTADDPATPDDETGLCDRTFADLAFGDYKVVETAAPAGYQLPTDPFYFTLGAAEAEMGDLVVQVDNDLIPLPGPAISKTANPASGSAVLRGDAITYTVTLTNTGVVPALGDVVDTLPSAVSVADAGTGSASVDGRTITWSGVSVAPGASVTLTYTVTVNVDAPAGSFSNSAVWTVGGKTYSAATAHTLVVPGGGGGGGGLPMTGDSGSLPWQVGIGSALVVGALGARRRLRRR